MEHTHTRGPWTNESTTSSEFVTRAIRGANDELVAHVGVPGYKKTPDVFESVKNADRIVACVNACEGMNPAAVPALLEACRMLLTRLETMPGLPKGMVYNFARQAIAQAEGRIMPPAPNTCQAHREDAYTDAEGKTHHRGVTT